MNSPAPRAPLPIYLRVGDDGNEHRIAELAPDDTATYDEPAIVAGLAGLLRAAAWAIENTNFADLLATLHADQPPSTQDRPEEGQL